MVDQEWALSNQSISRRSDKDEGSFALVPVASAASNETTAASKCTTCVKGPGPVQFNIASMRSEKTICLSLKKLRSVAFGRNNASLRKL